MPVMGIFLFRVVFFAPNNELFIKFMLKEYMCTLFSCKLNYSD